MVPEHLFDLSKLFYRSIFHPDYKLNALQCPIQTPLSYEIKLLLAGSDIFPFSMGVYPQILVTLS